MIHKYLFTKPQFREISKTNHQIHDRKFQSHWNFEICDNMLKNKIIYVTCYMILYVLYLKYKNILYINYYQIIIFINKFK